MIQRHSRNLDVLRAFAVTAVLVGHLDQIFVWHGESVITSAARFGVMAFFVHTALVLMQSLERMDGDGTGSLFGRFYNRRVFRIYPLSIACVIAVAVFHIPYLPWQTFQPSTRSALLSNLLLMQNLTHRSATVIAPLWSLPFEVQMYVVLPLFYLLMKRWPRLNPIFLVLIAMAANAPQLPHRFTAAIRYFPCFLAGVMAYRLHSLNRKHGRLHSFWLLPFLLLACAIYSISRVYQLDHTPGQNYLIAATDWLVSLTIGLGLPMIKEIPASWFWRGAQEIAKYSYGIYLSHMPVLWFVAVPMATQPFALRVAVLVIGVVTIPIAAYHLLESPMIEIGKRLSTPRPGLAARPAVA